MSSNSKVEASPQHNSDEEDSESDYDPEEIEKELKGVKSMLQRHCGRHKVRKKKGHSIRHQM